MWYVYVCIYAECVCECARVWTREDKLIVSFPPCKMQKLHWDFDPDVVQGLIQAKKYEGIPISTIASFSPNG